MHTKNKSVENLKQIDQLEDLSVKGRIILGWMLEKYYKVGCELDSSGLG
jgi:hypothetical protein